MSTLGERLRELRGKTSQAEMARVLGMARPQWIRYENGESTPGVDILERICRAHAVSADWLLGLKDGGGTAIARGSHAVAIVGDGNRVGPGEAAACAKCPYRRRLAKIEKALSV